MKTSEIKKNIHEAVDKIEDPNLLQAFYTILEKQIESEVGHPLSNDQKKELNKRLANHKNGSGKTYPWSEVKKDWQKGQDEVFHCFYRSRKRCCTCFRLV